MRLVSEDRTEHQRTEDGDAGLDEIKKSINKLNKVAKESHMNWVEAEQSKGVNLGARAAFVEPWAMALPEERTLGTEHWGGTIRLSVTSVGLRTNRILKTENSPALIFCANLGTLKLTSARKSE